MRLDKLTIGEFKNLRNLYVDFDASSPYTVLVGENGSGKSNLIEALALIFRNLDLDIEAPFAYQLKYRCRERDVQVHAAAAGAMPQFWARDVGADEYVEIPRRQFVAEDDDGRPLYRPAFVFGYYSGPSDRLAVLFERHRERYYRFIIKPRAARAARITSSNALRRLFYARTLHGQFALLAFFMESSTEDRRFLRQHLQIEGLDSVLFALKRPPWATNAKTGGDSRFWSAEGEVREFLTRLYDAALLPARMMRRIPVDLTKDPLVESLYLFLPDASSLERVYQSYGSQYAFFTALESMYISKVLTEVRTRVRMSTAAGGQAVTYRDLSEGEQQLLLVLGLLKFTAEDEALFLLDEPDTHLNPAWSTQYLNFLDAFIRGRETCQIVMSTHDPLVFAGLQKEQVRIFRRDTRGCVVAEEPLEDPRGMGIQAILASDLFRLRSAGLDAETLHDLERQRRLAARSDLTPAEDEELRAVTDHLHTLGFWQTIRDPLYRLFLQKWTAREKPAWSRGVTLTPEQLREREALAEEIAAEIAAERSDAT
jgi:predicted ATPase